jgi:hypothetical protein
MEKRNPFEIERPDGTSIRLDQDKLYKIGAVFEAREAEAMHRITLRAQLGAIIAFCAALTAHAIALPADSGLKPYLQVIDAVALVAALMVPLTVGFHWLARKRLKDSVKRVQSLQGATRTRV